MFLSPFLDGDVTVNFENSNGHMIPVGEESTREENVVRSEEGNGSVAEKAPPLEEKAEDKKGKIKRNPTILLQLKDEKQVLGSTHSDPETSREEFCKYKERMITSKEKWDGFLR